MRSTRPGSAEASWTARHRRARTKTRRRGSDVQGLAHALAEDGFFPMYGMPTRVRNLYLRFDKLYRQWKGRRLWEGARCISVDRDVDLAVFEWAPGARLTKDKREYECVGFSPSVVASFRRPWTWKKGVPEQDRVMTVTRPGDPLGNSFWVAGCPSCSEWRYDETEPKLESVLQCIACGAVIPPSVYRRCREPIAFRTDFKSEPAQTDEATTAGFRCLQADAAPMDLKLVPGTKFAMPTPYGYPDLQAQPGPARDHRGRNGRLSRIRDAAR